MGNLPPPNHDANVPEDEPANPEPAPIIPNHAPVQPDGYLSDVEVEDDVEEDDEEEPEEDEPVPEPNNMNGFALHMNPQPEGNMNGWLIDDDELEEDVVGDNDEEMEVDENDKENGGNDVEDDVEVIHPYEEADPLNRPPPTSDEEFEFAPLWFLLLMLTMSRIQPSSLLSVRQVSGPVPMGRCLESVNRGVKRLDKQMFDRYNTEIRMAKKFKEGDLRMNRHEYDIAALDAADDEDNGGDDNEDEAKVINAYEEVDPLNRPPPTSDEETEFAPPVVPIVDVDDEPIPPVIQFGHNFHVGESLSARTLLEGVPRLDKQMFDRYKTEKKMAKKFKEDEFRMNRHEYDITALDTAVRKNSSDHSEMKKFVLGLSRQFNELKEQNQEPPIHFVSAPRVDDPYTIVRDAAMAAREDDDDDTTAPKDSQPSETRGSPRDAH
ncbi:hypothetical protein Tco_0811893 [Tanacetum coccineum]